mmetsp:Transcript_10692/g.65929  ORF Transcript_10692/g.65929 Transcript_10692/m.65929 type:complete len:207 (-) Transcript_10692:1265-1885(-)
MEVLRGKWSVRIPCRKLHLQNICTRKCIILGRQKEVAPRSQYQTTVHSIANQGWEQLTLPLHSNIEFEPQTRIRFLAPRRGRWDDAPERFKATDFCCIGGALHQGSCYIYQRGIIHTFYFKEIDCNLVLFSAIDQIAYPLEQETKNQCICSDPWHCLNHFVFLNILYNPNEVTVVKRVHIWAHSQIASMCKNRKLKAFKCASVSHG